MINKINVYTTSQNITLKNFQPSFGRIEKLTMFMGSPYRTPCSPDKEIIILNKLIKLVQKGKVEFMEKFETKQIIWKDKYKIKGFRNRIIQVQVPKNPNERPFIEYLAKKNKLYTLHQASKDKGLLYNILLEGLKKCSGDRTQIKPYLIKAKIIKLPQK